MTNFLTAAECRIIVKSEIRRVAKRQPAPFKLARFLKLWFNKSNLSDLTLVQLDQAAALFGLRGVAVSKRAITKAHEIPLPGEREHVEALRKIGLA